MDEDLRSRYRIERHDYSDLPERPKPINTVQKIDHKSDKPNLTEAPAKPEKEELFVPMPRHAEKSRKKRSYAWLWKSVSAIILISGLIAGGIFAYPKIVKANPFPDGIRSTAKYSLFYPQKLPIGYIVDTSTIKIDNGTVTFRAVNVSGQRLVFTQQKIPPGINLGTFYNTQLKDMHSFSTSYGQAVIGVNNNRQIGSLATNGTWLLLTTNSQQTSMDDMSLVINNLKLY